MTSTTHLLREILLESKARTQSEIQHELQQRGESYSQSKISRLLHQIGAVKLIDSQGKTHYRLPHEQGLLHELTPTHEKTYMSEWVLDIVANSTLIIIHTTPGAAAMVARIIDHHRVDLQVIGSIAGDDTIFVAPKNNLHIENTITKISQLFHL